MFKLTIALSIATVVVLALPARAETVILPHRVIDNSTHTVIDFEGLLARCSDADVVTVGENHDDPATHMAELAILEGLHRTSGNVVFSMEMFERDVQLLLNAYLAGDIPEEQFIAGGRPWDNYQTDYRPMVEFARSNSIPVIAANVPRPLAGTVSQSGYAMADFSDEERALMASTFDAPRDAYWDAFSAVMLDPQMGGMNVSEETVWNYYEAQVLKDETMAESVSTAAIAHPDSVVFHITGSFHVADYLGTFSRIQRNLPGSDCVSIIVIPVDDLLAPPPEDTPKADYWILVLAPEESGMEEMPSMPPMPGGGQMPPQE